MDRQAATRTRLADPKTRQRISDLFDSYLQQRKFGQPVSYERRFSEILETVSQQYPEACPVLLCWRVWVAKWKETLALSCLGSKSAQSGSEAEAREVFNHYWTQTRDIKFGRATHRSLGQRFCPRLNHQPQTCCLLREIRDEVQFAPETNRDLLRKARSGSELFGTYDADTGEILTEPKEGTQYISNRHAALLNGRNRS